MVLGICIEIGVVSVGLGLLGLLFDLAGASLIVAIDISRFDFIWRNNERAKKAEALQKARRKLFQDNSIEEGAVGFDLAKGVILEERALVNRSTAAVSTVRTRKVKRETADGPCLRFPASLAKRSS